MMEHGRSIEAETLEKLKGLSSPGGDLKEIQTHLGLEKIFRKIHRLLNEGKSSGEVLDAAFDLLRDILDFDRIGVALLEDRDSRLRLCWMRTKLQAEELTEDFKSATISEGLGKILKTGTPRIINDLSEYFDTHPDSQTTPMILWDGIRSSLTCPLLFRGKNVGLIFFSSSVPYAYSHMDTDLYEEVSGLISLIMKDYVGSLGELYESKTK